MPEKFTGAHMAGVMALFFGVIIAVNITLAVFAGSTWTGLVVKNTYVASQQFNEETERRRSEAAMGWKAFAGYRDRQFTLELTDREGRIIQDALVVAKIGRPVSEHDDREVILRQGRDNHYVAETVLGPGLWDADISVKNSVGQTWSRRIRFTITAAGEIRSR